MYALTGLLGLLVTGVAAVLAYPVLVDLTRPLRVLSTAALVLLLLTARVLVWSGPEVRCDRKRATGGSVLEGRHYRRPSVSASPL